MAKVKPIHLITIKYGNDCTAVCNRYVDVTPIEALLIKYSPYYKRAKGTFNPEKVTCKRCLKHSDYKIASDKIKYPLFHWKEFCL